MRVQIFVQREYGKSRTDGEHDWWHYIAHTYNTLAIKNRFHVVQKIFSNRAKLQSQITLSTGLWQMGNDNTIQSAEYSDANV